MNPAAAAPANKKNKRTSESLKRRTKSLKKKASELSALCGVDIGMICHTPGNADGANNPQTTWPEDPSRLKDTVQRFQSARSSGKLKKMSSIKDFLGKKAKPGAGPAADHDLPAIQQEEIMSWCDELDQLSEQELRVFACHLEKQEQKVREEEKKHQLNVVPVLNAAESDAGNRVIPTLIEFDILKK